MNQGERIKKERERLGFNQTDFAKLAGASKHSQINWEKGASFPNSSVLEAWAKVGLDVLFVVIGQRTPNTSLDVVENIEPERKEWIDSYDEIPPSKRRAILEVVGGLSQSKPSKEAG
ncbi:TPA: helix-turn-helix domain-containing protein [Providencia rettgeri]|nr:transcriptional regulator [Providencia rettgeri]